jgi:hypothetical protein
VDWFQTSGVHLVRIVGTDDQRIDLLLIPLDTEEATADLALTMATDGHDPDITATVGDHTAPVGPPADAEESPDNDDDARTAMPTTAPGDHPATSSAADASLSRRRPGPAQ